MQVIQTSDVAIAMFWEITPDSHSSFEGSKYRFQFYQLPMVKFGFG